ncbi:putative RNA pseudouridine synthase [Phycisphaerales bacterium]|nr:putative RNA pseudouridine synthase [Phycisphaerales bacterium]
MPKSQPHPKRPEPKQKDKPPHTPRKPHGPHEPREIWLPGAIRVVHEDEHLVIVDKPAGMATVNAPEHRIPNVFDEVKAYVRDQVRRRGTRVWVIHRLDKEASGLLVFAKTEKAFHWLKEEFRTKRVQRLYAAVVEGEVRRDEGITKPDADEPPSPAKKPHKGRAALEQPLSGTIQSFLFEDDRGLVHSLPTPTPPHGLRDVEGEDRGAKLAVTHWQAQQVGSGRTLMQVRLETGRKHQIRVHLASIRKPIVGDRRYGSTTDPLGRTCLHAFELAFAHPQTGEQVKFRSPTPGSFFGLVGKSDSKADSEAPGELIEPPTAEAAPPPPPPAIATPQPVTSQASWDHVADWYDTLIDDRGSDHHQNLILPSTVRLLGPVSGKRVLDVACGQGILCRRLAALGAKCVGIDASERLIESARRAGGGEFLVGDARNLVSAVKGRFDAAACVLALMNIDPLSPLTRGVAELLAPGGVFVGIILHPAFRAPGQTSWAWDESRPHPDHAGPRGLKPKHFQPRRATPMRSPGPDAALRQYRRVDGYLSPGQKEIVMNPGAAAHGKKAVTTITYHRPIQAYVRAFAEAGLLIDAIEEWPSLRSSQPGPRAAEENRARREIPMFLAIRAVKASRPNSGGPASPE